jgi:hypothetical protein
MIRAFTTGTLWRVTRADWSEFVERTQRFGPSERERWNREHEEFAASLKKVPLEQWTALREEWYARIVPDPRVWLRNRGRALGAQSVNVENHLVQLLLTGTLESAFGVFAAPWEPLEGDALRAAVTVLDGFSLARLRARIREDFPAALLQQELGFLSSEMEPLKKDLVKTFNGTRKFYRDALERDACVVVDAPDSTPR